jgi:hypothetical protein
VSCFGKVAKLGVYFSSIKCLVNCHVCGGLAILATLSFYAWLRYLVSDSLGKFGLELFVIFDAFVRDVRQR